MSLKTKIATYRVKQLTEAMQYKGKLARIVGEPFAGPLDKAYPRAALSRKALRQAVEMSNNAVLLGHGKANVNGESRRGVYFRATDGSAKGVAWQAGVKVYRAKQLGPDYFFADESHIGVKIKESTEPTEPDLPEEPDEEEDDEEEEEDDDEECESCGKKHGKKSKKKDMEEKVGTDLIQRALRGIGAGASEVKVAKALQKSGVSQEDAFLAIKAAKILLKDLVKEAAGDKPLPPLHKWPVKIEKGRSVYTLKDFKVTEKGEPPGSGLYEYELFFKGKSAGKFSNQREVVAKAQALRGK